MDGGGSGIIGDRSGGCFDMGDEVWAVFLTGFGQMNLEPHPTGTLLANEINRRNRRLCDQIA
jgi:hypothetical protein